VEHGLAVEIPELEVRQLWPLGFGKCLAAGSGFGFVELDAGGLSLFAVVIDDGYGVAGAMVVHEVGEVLVVLDRLAIDLDDEIAADDDFVVAVIDALIAALDSGAFGGRTGDDLHDQHSGLGGERS